MNVSSLQSLKVWSLRETRGSSFPTFFESMAALGAMTVDGSLLQAYVDTLRPLVLGLLISAFIGIAIGLWIGLTNWFD